MTDQQPLRDRSSQARRPAAIARHGKQKTSAAWKTVLGLLGGVLVVVLVSGGAVGGVVAWQFTHNIQDNSVAIGADTAPPPPNLAEYEGGFNLLVVGSDTREGQGGIGGRDPGSTLNDVNILLHVAQDQKSATLVSIPRDMVMPMPRCERGGPASGLPLNNAYSYGGLACVVATVENFTGLTIQFAALTTFRGVISMSNAVGGVDVCIAGPIDDPRAGLYIPEAGTYNLQGEQALAFLRSRHGVGDGSDLGRISSQQVYLSSLVRKIKADGTLTDPTKLFSIAQTAISLTGSNNIVLSQNLASLDTLVSLAMVLKNIPLENITMVQYPGTTGQPGIYAGKVAPLKAQGNALIAAIKADQPIALDDQALASHGATELDPNAPAETPQDPAAPDPSSSPTLPGTGEDAGPDPVVVSGVKGQSAAQYTCSKPFGT